MFSARFACPVSGFTIDEIEPRLFSFNAPAGACPTCDGLGTELRFEPDLVVPQCELSLAEGAIYPWAKTGVTSPYYEQTLESLAKHYKVIDEDAVGAAAQARAARDPLRLGRRRHRVHLLGRHAQLHDRKAVRRRDRQHRAALARNG